MLENENKELYRKIIKPAIECKYSNSPTFKTMLKEGHYDLAEQLRDEYVDYFYGNYLRLEDKLYSPSAEHYVATIEDCVGGEIL